ncbi:MAG: GNAT family N-acetyltransferase [Alphaproteobacteria bacterium]|nr:GNAT family N-acetyltransferase [Alphaproteobacteria bacterium]
MFEKIERDDDIFQSKAFLKDSMAFCLMDSIREDTEKYPEARLFSDGKDCIIVNSDPNHSIIVWTTDNFKAKDELFDFIKQEFKANHPIKIMSKKEFYDYLLENHKIPNLKVQTLGVYSCPKLNDVKYVGHPDNARPEEVEMVAQMLVNFGKETGENPNAQLSDCLKTAQDFVSVPMHCVWRDDEGKMVAIAKLKTNVKYPRISEVYTWPQERGKSYAKMLVHYLTDQALKNGKTPMLFTDYDYEPSNRCYQAIGYELNCTIVNFIPPLQNKIKVRERE